MTTSKHMRDDIELIKQQDASQQKIRNENHHAILSFEVGSISELLEATMRFREDEIYSSVSCWFN